MSLMTKTLRTAFAVILSAVLLTCAGIEPASQNEGLSFTGDGGKDISLAVLVPTAQGIAVDQNYLPTLVQGVLVGDLKKHSAISVLDRYRLETVLRETESGIYRNEDDFGRLGEIANVDYVLTGSITKTGSGYAIDIRVVGTGRGNIGVAKAAYSGSCTIAELDNFTGIRRASLELLTQMGVALTASARNELSGAASRNTIDSQTALAQGIVSQQSGNEFEAMLSFFDARTLDASLSEAATRISSASTTLANNNWQNTGIRDQVLSEIAQMREADRLEAERASNIKELLKKASKFYRVNQPYQILLPDTFTYGNINHIRNTVDVSVSMGVAPNLEEFRVIAELTGLANSVYEERGWNENYNIWPYYNPPYFDYFTLPIMFPFFFWLFFDSDYVDYFWNKVGIWEEDPVFKVQAVVINENGKQLGRISFTGRGSYSGNFDSTVHSLTISANDFTDTLTMRIVSVNGKSVRNIMSSGYVGIPRESAVLSAVGRL